MGVDDSDLDESVNKSSEAGNDSVSQTEIDQQVTPAKQKKVIVIGVFIALIIILLLCVFGYVYLKPSPKDKKVVSPKPSTKSEVKKITTMTFPVTVQQVSEYTSQLRAASTVADANVVINKFASGYGYEVVASTTFSSAEQEIRGSWQPLFERDLGLLKNYGSWLMTEWLKYPKEWVQQTKLKKIIFANDLKLEGTAANVLGFVDPDVPWVLIDIKNAETGQSTALKILHHEYGHLVDFSLVSMIGLEAEWKAFNPPDFTYSNASGGIENLTGVVRHPQMGFVSNFALQNVDEDRAEIYSYLFSTSHYHLLQTWLPSDPYLQKKVDYFKKLIKDTVPGMDDAYLSRINP